MSYVLLGLLYMTLAAVSVSSDSIFDNLALPDVQAIKVRLEEGRADLLLLQNDLEVLMEKVAGMERDNENRPHAQSQENGIGALYVRWGRKSCEGQGTQLVYEGYVGGSYYNHKGGAVNTLCLPRDPIYNKTQPGVQGHHGGGYVYGVEYAFHSGNSIDAKYNELRYQEMPCAVCRAPRSTVLMVPGRNICYDGWTQEYRGYLIAGHYNHNAATRYECMDENPETVSDQVTVNNYGAWFYFVESRCSGTLPCPPYVDGNELTCAVCTL